MCKSFLVTVAAVQSTHGITENGKSYSLNGKPTVIAKTNGNLICVSELNFT